MEFHNGLILVSLLLVASFGYCCFLVPLLPKGITRLLFLLPVFYILSIFPWIFSSIALRSLSSFLITWITSFKLILLCFDQGPLFDATTRFIDFTLIAILPIKLREATQHDDHVHTSNGLVTIGVWLLSILWCLFTLSTTIWFQFLVPILIILALIYWSSTSSATRLARAVLARYEMVQLSDHPENSSSLQEFWGRRWNRLASDLLRQAIYDPVRNGLTMIGISPLAARVVAVIATLMVSGLMHELMFYYITCGARPTWDLALFFVLQGVCMAIEYAMSGSAMPYWATRWEPVGPSVATWLTLGFVSVTGFWLVLLPTLRKVEYECRTVPKVW
ncbi:unnamed protein product [Linum tenue]|uniref:Wax synthase domain-containing protein n=1 Tax=Linum tenue TaxID=586396 RepID=A0AAV0GPX7_9ROSI|nr:unnamed protein product [Linum tenue]